MKCLEFILGFLLYMMIMFVWGKTVVSEENLNSGFKVSELMQEVGFEDGDKILTVDGKEIVDQFDINKMLFTRGISQVQALSLNGQRKTINIPDTVGYTTPSEFTKIITTLKNKGNKN